MLRVGDLTFNVVVEGAAEGEPVVLLHGFPNSAALWRCVAPLMVARGYRVIAPDLRGAGASDAPAGKASYDLSLLAADVLGIMAALHVEKAHLVGHDWGAVLAWLLAGEHRERFRTLSALSVGHPRAYARAGLAQLLRAWYIGLFAMPGVAEAVLTARDWAFFRKGMHHPDVDAWVTDLARPGRLTAFLNWYRQNSFKPITKTRTSLPVLGVWSSNDPVLTEAQMIGSKQFVAGSFRYERLDGVGHWIPLDQPETLARLLLEFFEAHGR